MSTAIKITVIGAGSIRFATKLIKDICLKDGLAGSHVVLVDINTERLQIVHKLAELYAHQVGSSVTFEKTVDRLEALKHADVVINTAFVLGHDTESQMRSYANEKYSYDYLDVSLGNYHQLELMRRVAHDMTQCCPDAWLLQLGNPVFDGCTLMKRETSIKICGLCHGYREYETIAKTLGIELNQVEWEAPGLNHNIWLRQFVYQGEDAYPLLDNWIREKSEAYWKDFKPTKIHDTQMSRSAVHQYELYGLFPIGDTVRRGGWWYHTDMLTKQHWFGQPWGGPDNLISRDHYITSLKEKMHTIVKCVQESQDLTKIIGTECSEQQTISIIDSIFNDNSASYQVNVANNGTIKGIPDDVFVETRAIVNKQGIHPLKKQHLPPKIMIERVLPDWLAMERNLLAFQTGDKSLLLHSILDNRQTATLDLAIKMLEDLLKMDDISLIEVLQSIYPIDKFYKYLGNIRS